jgi:hypothetical protein
MALGNEVGVFSLEVTSTTYSTGADGVSHVVINMGGELEGGGQSDVVLGTLEGGDVVDEILKQL